MTEFRRVLFRSTILYGQYTASDVCTTWDDDHVGRWEDKNEVNAQWDNGERERAERGEVWNGRISGSQDGLVL